MAARNLRTEGELKQQGYVFVLEKPCSYHPCTSTIHMYRTPAGKLMPFDKIEITENDLVKTVFEPHFGNCAGIEGRNAVRAAGGHQEQEPGESKAAAK